MLTGMAMRRSASFLKPDSIPQKSPQVSNELADAMHEEMHEIPLTQLTPTTNNEDGAAAQFEDARSLEKANVDQSNSLERPEQGEKSLSDVLRLDPLTDIVLDGGQHVLPSDNMEAILSEFFEKSKYERAQRQGSSKKTHRKMMIMLAVTLMAMMNFLRNVRSRISDSQAGAPWG